MDVWFCAIILMLFLPNIPKHWSLVRCRSYWWRKPRTGRNARKIRWVTRCRCGNTWGYYIGIGMALRGLRPIAEIQYLDYLMYTNHEWWFSYTQIPNCRQTKAPLIIRTRGHRLEGIWHSGSPMEWSTQLRNSCLVPRNMTQAAGFIIVCSNVMNRLW
jgi:hypothetical protein